VNLCYKIWAWLTGQKIVYLQDFDGEITKTFATKTPFGWVAKRHWPESLKNVLLLKNGLVENGVYVTKWMPENPNDFDDKGDKK